ncbi:hypothetical protein BH10BAC2_BH10BAC2_03690 [soil metagenome]|jgi:hypothetical protein
MQFDINEVLADMLGAVKKVAKENWDMVKTTANDFMQSRKLRLELLASFRLENQISQEFFEARLKDEKAILQSELHAVAVISKATAQKAANAAITVLESAVSKILGLV